ncbi:MAG: type I polyketide synthase, partial [Myxococcota bacterium]
ALADYLSETTRYTTSPSTRLRVDPQEPVEPIAIISSACRWPGDVESIEDLHRLLVENRDAITEVPAQRWDVEDYYDADPDGAGTVTTRWGGFLKDIEHFDADFFGMGPTEAATVDPQQRLLLETAWEAFERAGMTRSKLAGSQTGVYVGISGTEYQYRAMADARALTPFSLLGTAHSAIVGRLSYWLGLQGPNFPIDTACSSSLVALHLACQGLRNGECETALAGGVNVLLDPMATIYFSRLQAMSPTGRCHTFGAQADGYVRSEGCGLVVLKRLSQAKADGDEILAIIRGSAINQDGHSNGFTAPNGTAQRMVIEQALRQGCIDAASVDAIECHGTGTPLGDPIEVAALGDVYGKARSNPVFVGSIKSNIGHTEAAAGIAGVLKATLALKHEVLPKTLHCQELNPKIAWSSANVDVLREARMWPRGQQPRRIGVSSFGFAGTNAHMILEEAPATSVESGKAMDGPWPLVITADSPAALRAQAKQLADHLRQPNVELSDAAFTLATARTAFRERLILVRNRAHNGESVEHALDQFAEGQGVPAAAAIGAAPSHRGQLAVLFTGQGSQYLGMGQGLYRRRGFEVFTQAFDDAVEACRHHLPTNLTDVMWAVPTPEAADRLQQTSFAQPALFALEIALYRQFEAWGVSADMFIGHSVGELTAAHAAGVLTLEDAATLICARGRSIQTLATSGGAMLAVEAS